MFQIEILSKTINPQQLVWSAMHQCYCEEVVWQEREKFPDENKAGELIVKHLLHGGKGHYSPLEAPTITFNIGYFPHSLVQQIRTHRMLSFAVQSGRYTGIRICNAVDGKIPLEDVFYLRPVGDYHDRQGKNYYYSPEQREEDLNLCLECAKLYKKRIDEGVSEEQARSTIPFDIRQHFVLTCNARSLMHLLDMRSPANAQLECQILCEMLMKEFKEWMPQVADWYEKYRFKKSKLSP